MEIKFLNKKELIELASNFCELYRNCFNDYIDEEIVIRRYVDNPYDELYMCVAIDNGKIVSNYAVSPSMIEYDGRKFKSALSLNTMTHPDYMGQGIFVKLASLLYAKLKEDGYKIVYGCPNFISNRTLCNRLNWVDIYEYPTMELVIDKDIPFDTSAISIVEAYKLSLEKDCKIKVSKDPAYMKWRYTNHPSNKYFCIQTSDMGWAIYKVYQNMINIVELHAVNKDDQRNIVGYILAEAKKMNIEKLTVWSRINSEEHFIFEKLGFRNRYPITYFGALDLGLSDEIGCDIWDYRNWSVNMGDDNVY